MTNDSCGCGHDHDEEKEEDGHACCGGSCHSDDAGSDEDTCGCGHDHGHAHEITPEQMEALKKAIIDAGYKIEETPDGDIKILEK